MLVFLVDGEFGKEIFFGDVRVGVASPGKPLYCFPPIHPQKFPGSSDTQPLFTHQVKQNALGGLPLRIGAEQRQDIIGKIDVYRHGTIVAAGPPRSSSI